ncbi:MAG: dephospho-CoA kinase [Phycisphaerae bacterium]|nr:dephospho-CoA kinase [Phycisphaerae bacterium]
MNGSPRPPVIGLVGGIGSGKSAVAAILEDLGCVVSDSDRDAREVLADPKVLEVLQGWWGDAIVATDGRLDRSEIAARVFGDPAERKRLEDLVHPRLHRLREDRFAAASDDTCGLVIDAPLLFEAHLDDQCDAIIFVDASIDRRIERVVTSRGWEEAELHRREQAQIPLDEKRRRASHVIENDGTRSELEGRVGVALDQIRNA